MRLVAIFAVTAALAAPALAQQPAKDAHGAHHAALADGEVRRVDKDAKKITIKHGPIANLDMPAMTMVFQVKDPALLEQVKAGDKVKFEAQKLGGAFTVTRIEVAK
jgi:Cu/Ag efflux protein CusF